MGHVIPLFPLRVIRKQTEDLRIRVPNQLRMNSRWTQLFEKSVIHPLRLEKLWWLF
jgi:hypothetical protein